jgi:hypothetical protein
VVPSVLVNLSDETKGICLPRIIRLWTNQPGKIVLRARSFVELCNLILKAKEAVVIVLGVYGRGSC